MNRGSFPVGSDHVAGSWSTPSLPQCETPNYEHVYTSDPVWLEFLFLKWSQKGGFNVKSPDLQMLATNLHFFKTLCGTNQTWLQARSETESLLSSASQTQSTPKRSVWCSWVGEGTGL
jgi:hypothetical protein